MLKFKFLCYVLILMVLSSTFGMTQPLEKELVRADSLYSKKQYIEAIKIYKKIYQQGNYSAAMLLKLARIEEGMGNLGHSMYYLEKYYQSTKDEKVISYLEETAENKKAIGFEYGVAYKADLLYKEWKIYFQLLFSILIISGVGMMLKNQGSTVKKKKYFALAVFALVIVAVVNNYNGKSEAILTSSPSYLMEGPSSGANLVRQISTPAKFQVKDEIDIWTKVIFEDRKAYIRTSRIKRL